MCQVSHLAAQSEPDHESKVGGLRESFESAVNQRCLIGSVRQRDQSYFLVGKHLL